MTDTTTHSTGTVSATLMAAVTVELQAHLGHAAMTVGALTALEPGAVVALDATIDRLVELRLNDVVIARGELVTVGETFGVRLTEVVAWPE